MTREEIAARVDALARDRQGEDFVAAIESFSAELDENGRDVLGAVLLERSRVFQNAADERAHAKGWLRRTLDPFQRRRQRL